MSAPTFDSIRFLLLRPCTVRTFPTFSSFSARSQFRRNYAKASKKVKPLPQKVKGQAKASITEKNTTTTSTSTTAAVLQQYVPLEAKLAQAGKEMLLYKKVHGRFLIATYGLVAACFGFVAINYRTGTTDTPPEVPAWVGKAHWVTMALVGGIGIGVAMYPTRIIQKIYAVPTKTGIEIVLHRRPLVPGFPEVKIPVANPKLITLDEPLQPLREPVKKVLEQTAPVGLGKRIGRAVVEAPWRAFVAVKRTITTDGFVGLQVQDGGRYQIKSDGWIWEKRGLDTLFRTMNTKYRY